MSDFCLTFLYLYIASLQTQQFAGSTCRFIRTQYPDFEQASLCSYSLELCA